MAQVLKTCVCLGHRSWALQRTNFATKITQNIQYNEKLNLFSPAACAFTDGFRHYSTLRGGRTNRTWNIQNNETFNTVFSVPCGFTDGFRYYSSLAGGNEFDTLLTAVKGVSTQGMKKGRAKSKKFFKFKRADKGGRSTMTFRGLHKPVYEKIEKKEEPKTTGKSAFTKKPKLLPLERGYSGTGARGRKFPAPAPIGDYDFVEHGFESIILERRQVKNMTSNIGRTRSFRIVAIVGNRNGLVGFAVGKGKDYKASFSQAILKAGKHLEFIERYENRTVMHNMFSKEVATKLYIIRKHEGYGLCCQRVIRSICELAGIHDLYVKIEGPTTTYHIVRAFFNALRSQKTYQKIADQYHLHVVETKREFGKIPRVIASPQDGNVKKTMTEDERRGLDFESLFWNRRILLNRGRKPKFYEKQQSFIRKKALEHRYRNQDDAKMKRFLAGLQQIKA